MANKTVTIVDVAQEDLALQSADNVTEETFSRTTWDGGTETVSKLTGNMLLWTDEYNRTIRPGDIIANGPWVDSRRSSSLAAVLTLWSGVEKTIIIAQTETIDANLSIPSTITLHFLRNGKLSINPGVTVTIYGSIIAVPKTIFSGSGSVVFSGKTIREVLPQWFGATGDGVTDDATAIQKSISSLTNGGLVTFSQGIYKVTSTISITYSNITLRGVNNSSSVFLANTLVEPLLKIQGGFGTEKERITIQDLGLRVDGSHISTLLFLEYAEKITINHCYFEHLTLNNGQIGIELDQGLESIFIRDNYFSSEYGIWKADEGSNPENIFIQRNTFERGGIKLIPVTTAMKNLVISGNQFLNINRMSGDANGIELIGNPAGVNNVQITDNLFYAIERYGIKATQVIGLIISNNIMSGYSEENSNTYDGILLNECQNYIVSNNIFDGNVTGRLAIYQAGGSDLNSVIMGNCSTNNSHSTLEYVIDDSSDDIVYMGNVPKEEKEKTITSLSANTLDVGFGSNYYLYATGTPTINAFSNGHNGQIIYLRFGKSTNIQESSTVKINDAGTFAAEVNDTMVLIRRASVWYEVSRSVN